MPPLRCLWYIPAVKPKNETPVIKVTTDGSRGIIDEVAAEVPVRLTLNNEPLVTLLCTPTELRELAVGFLLSEGLVRNAMDIIAVDIPAGEPRIGITIASLPDDWRSRFNTRAISSGCGQGITFTNYDRDRDRRMIAQDAGITVDDIRALLKDFRNSSSLYLETGGVHSAALAEGRKILLFSEDIGRHNAVDKLVGKAFLQGVPVQGKLLVTSGRVTSEMTTKAGRNGIPVLISRAAPSCMAISYAEDMGITLVGFARGERMNIYSWPNRIRL